MQKNFLAILFLLFALAGCDDGPTKAGGGGQPVPIDPATGWEQPLPLAGASNLWDVWTLASGWSVAVGTDGTVVTNDGGGWQQQDAGTAEDLYGVIAFATDDVTVVGANGTILHFDGSGWSSQVSGTVFLLREVWGSAGDNLFAVGDRGTLLRYDGSSWSAVGSGTTLLLNDVWGVGDDVWVTGINDTVLHYDGSTWLRESIGSGFLTSAVWASDPSNVIVAGTQSIRQFDGTMWVDINDTGSGFLFPDGLWGSAPNDVWLVGANGFVFNYDGSTWATVQSGTQLLMHGVSGANGNTVVVGESGSLLRNEGSGFSYDDGGMSATLNAVWAQGDVAVAVGDFGNVLVYDGAEWTQQRVSGAESLFGVHGSGVTDVWAVGLDGAAYHYDGSSWTPSASGTTDGLFDVWTDGAVAYAVGEAGAVQFFDGTTWTTIDLGAGGSFFAVDGSSSDEVWVVGSESRVRRFDGDKWKTVFVSTFDYNLREVIVLSPTEVFVGLEFLGGPRQPDGDVLHGGGQVLAYDGTAFNIEFDSGSQDIWSIARVTGSEAWAVGDFGYLMFGDADGWTPVWEGSSRITVKGLYSVAAPASGQVYIVGQGGTVFQRR